MTPGPVLALPDRAMVSDTLAHGHVVTVAPGVLPAGIGRGRIEDTVVVTTDGFWSDTTIPKDFSVHANPQVDR